jgi:hypothetical protein
MLNYIEVSKQLPPDGVPVYTKVHEHNGIRHEEVILKRSGNLWFIPDGSMYVYYTPTHWAAI